MMKQLFCVSAAVVLAAFSFSCMAQSAPDASAWSGSWKVDQSSVHFEGVVYTIADDGKGFKISSGGKEVSKMDCSGKPVTNPSGSVSTCVKSGAGYAVTNTRDGKPLSTAMLAVEPGGKKMTRTQHVTPATEAPYTMTLTYERVGMGKGMSGDWKETGVVESQDTGVLGIEIKGDSVSFKETDSPTPMVCKLDGTPTKFGSNTMSVVAIDPHTLKVKYMNGDKLLRENTFALSLDGKMTSETDFTNEPAPSAETKLFHKM